jgi:hypothetical protein
MGIEKPVYEAAMKGTPTTAPSSEGIWMEVTNKTFFHERHKPFICSCCSFNIDPPKFTRTHVLLVTKNIDLTTDKIYPATLCNECRQETDALDSLYRPHMSIDMNTIFRVEVILEKTNVGTWVIRDNDGHPVYEKRTRRGAYEAAVDDNFEAVFGDIALVYEVVQ